MSKKVAQPVSPISFRALAAHLLNRVIGSLKTAGGEPAAPVVKVEACGGDVCDGYGWINGVTAGYRWARPCPDCPPEVRRSPCPRP